MPSFEVKIDHPRVPNSELLLGFPNLPITDAVHSIGNLVQSNQVVIVVGETGSGKTTQLPKICLWLGRGKVKQIVHTQPRRLAARSVAARIASELDTEIGDFVGYQVRFQKKETRNTTIKLVTDGLLLAEFRDDRLLSKYDTVIIDEAHERSLNIDFLLGILSQILPKRPDLKVIVTSATINYEKFSAHFNDAPVAQVSGRSYPVEIRYFSTTNIEIEKTDGTGLPQKIKQTIFELRKIDQSLKQTFGDILVFLPGEREIRDVSQFLRHAFVDQLDVLPLYARLGTKEQTRIFYPSNQGLQRIILATNVAETSLTVPGIRYVIDSGLARISRYSPKGRIQRLPIEPISQASANQRAGRCGRNEPGIAIRLYEKLDFESRSSFTDPEIMRTNLAAVVLQCLDLKLGDPLKFPFVEPPEPKLVRDGLNQLKELNLICQNGQLTTLGREVARLPLDPRIGRMLIEAIDRKVFWEVSIVAAVLTLQDPRESDFNLSEINNSQSQFVTLLNLWILIDSQRIKLSNSQFKKWCVSVGLSNNRVREWRDVHRQILLCFPQIKYQQLTLDAFDLKGFHIALLTAFSSNIGRLDNHNYQGIRNRKFNINKKTLGSKPRWVMAAELVDTSRVIARTVAKIEPRWVIEAVPNLLKFSFDTPRWSKKEGRVICNRTTRIFGLILRDKEWVGYQAIEPKQARKLFLLEAMIHGAVRSRLPIFAHNLKVFNDAQMLQEKLRRVDITFDSEEMIEWFDERVPSDICDIRSFETWWRGAPRKLRSELFLDQRDLLRDPADLPDHNLFPENLVFGHLTLPTEYRFAPGKRDDGISIKIPITALMQINAASLDFMVPGVLHEKIEALVRGLPKFIRRQLVPIPDFVKQATPLIDSQRETLYHGLSRLIFKRTGITPDKDLWSNLELDDRFRILVEVVDESGFVIDSDRDIEELKRRLVDQIPANSRAESKLIFQWDPDLFFEESIKIEHCGMQMFAYPRLVLTNADIRSCQLFDPVDAKVLHSEAVAELLVRACSDLFRFMEAKDTTYQKALISICGSKIDRQNWQRLLVESATDSELSQVRSYSEFDGLRSRIRPLLVSHANKLMVSLLQCQSRVNSLKQRLEGKIPSTWMFNINAIQSHLRLLTDDILNTTPPAYLKHLNRYTEGLEIRLEKLSSRLLLDAQWQREVDILWSELQHDWPSLPEDWRRQKSELIDLRWKIEEFRVLCFAQSLKTAQKVSFKRLKQLITDYRELC